MFDALGHLERSPPDMLERYAAAGVTDVVSAGTDPLLDETVPEHRDVRVHRAYGIHPEAVRADRLAHQLEVLRARLTRPGVVALGECGLDGRRHMPPLDLQEGALADQLALAKALGLPVILHGVRAHGRLLDVVRRAAQDGPIRAVWHGFSGAFETARRAIELGVVLSVGRFVLAPAARLHDTLRRLPDPVLLETDAPELGPEGLADVAAAVAALRDRRPDAVREEAIALARHVYGLAVPASPWTD